MTTKTTSLGNPFVFFLNWISSPLLTGAVLPSSAALSKAMASFAPVEGAGKIIELGAGTGVVTRELIARGIDPGRIVCVEMLPKFCEVLKENFPGVTVLKADAYDIVDIVKQLGLKKVDAIVSSLPLLTQTADDRVKFINNCMSVLEKGGGLTQFTYKPTSPIPLNKDANITEELRARIWFNVFPATVWLYTKK